MPWQKGEFWYSSAVAELPRWLGLEYMRMSRSSLGKAQNTRRSCTGSGMRGNLSSIRWKGTVLATSLEAMSSSVPGLCLLHTSRMLGDRGVMMEHHRHGVLQPNKMQIMGGSDLALQSNGWYRICQLVDMICSLITVSPKIQVGLVPGSFLPLPESGVFVGAVALVAVLAARTLPPRHLQQYWNILNRYIDTSHPPPLTVSSHAPCSSHWRWSRPRTTWCRCPCYEQPPGRDMSQ